MPLPYYFVATVNQVKPAIFAGLTDVSEKTVETNDVVSGRLEEGLEVLR